MADKKFLGKIHGEPWEALAKGPREALGTIWNSYLAEVLQVSPKSARYQIMRREIEAAAGFKEVYDNWNTLSPESRAVAWRRLMTASRNHLLEQGEAFGRVVRMRREAEVHRGHGGLEPTQLSDCRSAIVRDYRFIGIESPAHLLLERGVVLDDQQRPARFRHQAASSIDLAGSGMPAATCGNSTRTRVPLPSRLSNRMRPPSPVTYCWLS